ncbi:MAG TPA: alanine racemase, partial [Chroococcales cyanobacterium]
MYNPAAGDSIETLDTPSMVIDLDIVESNIARLVERFRDSKVALRPHLKTAKCPELARKMLEAGITGFCVAKVSEAEVLADAGIDDLLITTEMIGKAKLERF